MGFDPSGVLVAVTCVDDEEELCFAHSVNEEIVHDSSVFVEHKSITDVSVGHRSDIVAYEIVDALHSVLALDNEFAHMRNVEHTYVVSDRVMFGDNAGFVLYRKKIARKFDYLSAVLYVIFIQRCFFDFHIAFSERFIIAC